jgi:hypothetical protein
MKSRTLRVIVPALTTPGLRARRLSGALPTELPVRQSASQHRIVAGVDGSPSSVAALTWAARKRT